MNKADKHASRIGLAGVGLMGLGIATNIIAKGWHLTLLDHPGNQPVGDLTSKGASIVQTGEALAKTCDIIILCVTGSPQVEDVLTRQDGILSGFSQGSVIIDCSTAVPSSTQLLAQKVLDAGGHFLDAPMTRTPKEAMAGKLNLIVGGDARLFEAVLPLLECFAENITHVGGVGSGHTMKLLHNYVSLGYTAVLAEAAASAMKAGIDPGVFVDVLAKGGGRSVVLDRISPYVTGGDPSGLMFSVANAHKDIGYYVQMAGDLGAGQLTAAGVLALLESQVQSGNGQKMLPEIIDILSSRGAEKG